MDRIKWGWINEKIEHKWMNRYNWMMNEWMNVWINESRIWNYKQDTGVNVKSWVVRMRWEGGGWLKRVQVPAGFEFLT